jgi:hypothetical protein
MFSAEFRKLFKYQILLNTSSWIAGCSMQLDGRTDMTKLIVAFRNLAKASKN